MRIVRYIVSDLGFFEGPSEGPALTEIDRHGHRGFFVTYEAAFEAANLAHLDVVEVTFETREAEPRYQAFMDAVQAVCDAHQMNLVSRHPSYSTGEQAYISIEDAQSRETLRNPMDFHARRPVDADAAACANCGGPARTPYDCDACGTPHDASDAVTAKEQAADDVRDAIVLALSPFFPSIPDKGEGNLDGAVEAVFTALKEGTDGT